LKTWDKKEFTRLVFYWKKKEKRRRKRKRWKIMKKAIRSSIPKRPVSLRYHPTPRDTLDRLITLSKSILVPPPTSFLLFLLFLFFLEKLIGFIGKWWYFWVNNCFIWAFYFCFCFFIWFFDSRWNEMPPSGVMGNNKLTRRTMKRERSKRLKRLKVGLVAPCLWNRFFWPTAGLSIKHKVTRKKQVVTWRSWRDGFEWRSGRRLGWEERGVRGRRQREILIDELNDVIQTQVLCRTSSLSLFWMFTVVTRAADDKMTTSRTHAHTHHTNVNGNKQIELDVRARGGQPHGLETRVLLVLHNGLGVISGHVVVSMLLVHRVLWGWREATRKGKMNEPTQRKERP